MNKVERDILHRMHCLLTAVPLPVTGGGTQSASITGFVSFGHDMAEMRTHLDMAWAHFNFKDYEEAKILLSAIEAWIDMRKEQQWQLVHASKTIKQFERDIELQRAQKDNEETL